MDNNRDGHTPWNISHLILWELFCDDVSDILVYRWHISHQQHHFQITVVFLKTILITKSNPVDIKNKA